MINELVDFARRNEKELFLFKVDFEKVFDSVSWDYLLYNLKRMKFGTKWIKACVCSNSLFKPNLNGSSTVVFQAKRGLREGDPFSPFLFNFVVEDLASLLKNVRSNLGFHPFKLSHNLEFDLLKFANDMLIVGHVSLENIFSIKVIICGLKILSGLSVNFHKSKIMGFQCGF